MKPTITTSPFLAMADTEWPKVPEACDLSAYETRLINQGTSGELLTFENYPEKIPYSWRLILLYKVRSVVETMIAQLHNRNYIPGDICAWRAGLTVASPPLSQGSLSQSSSQPALSPGYYDESERKLIVKIVDPDLIKEHRTRSSKKLLRCFRNFLKDLQRGWATDVAADVAAVSQLENGKIRILMKTRSGAELMNCFNAATLPCFGAGAFAYVPTFSIKVEQFFKAFDGERVKEMIEANKDRIPGAKVRHCSWLNDGTLVIGFAQAKNAKFACARGLEWDGTLYGC